MKQEFKKFLLQHKGKVLDSELINIISEKHEDEIGDMLYNEGLCIESLNNGKNIIYGNCEKGETNWAVQDMWKTEKEFKTLRGAITYINQ
jgi:hypothetical protein